MDGFFLYFIIIVYWKVVLLWDRNLIVIVMLVKCILKVWNWVDVLFKCREKVFWFVLNGCLLWWILMFILFFRLLIVNLFLFDCFIFKLIIDEVILLLL